MRNQTAQWEKMCKEHKQVTHKRRNTKIQYVYEKVITNKSEILKKTVTNHFSSIRLPKIEKINDTWY